MKRLYERSDLLGLLQTGGYLGLLIATGALAWYSAYHFHWYVTVLIVFTYGTFFAFQINAVHEIGHYTVFKSKWLSTFFVHLFSFFGWINHRWFEASHTRHHRSTLHPPDDLEVTLPIKFTLRDFLKNSFISPLGLKYQITNNLRIARGKFAGPWELKLFPEGNDDKKKPVMAWSRTILIGHATIVLVSIAMRWWMLPVLTTLAPFYGSWLFFLCNNTQHVGLTDNSDDFRMCCRTFIPNPFVRFLYWHMNYHTEHHMYVGVPCYRLAHLHKLIESDLPPTPMGLIGVWREIGAILKKQAADPTFQYAPPVPQSAVVVAPDGERAEEYA